MPTFPLSCQGQQFSLSLWIILRDSRLPAKDCDKFGKFFFCERRRRSFMSYGGCVDHSNRSLVSNLKDVDRDQTSIAGSDFSALRPQRLSYMTTLINC